MVDFALLPTPKGSYYVAAGRITWLGDDPSDAARTLIWLDDGSQHTVLMSPSDLVQLLHTVSAPAPAP